MKKLKAKCFLLFIIIVLLLLLSQGCSKSQPLNNKKPRLSSQSEVENQTASCVGNPQKEEQRWKEALSAPKTSEEDKNQSQEYAKTLLSKGIVVVDPGHGEPGNPGSGGRSGLRERDMNLDMAKRLKVLLEEAGVKVVMTRSEDATVLGNPERAEIANKNHANLFFRIHCDSSSNPQDAGTRTLWYKTDSKRPAEIIQKAMVKELGLQDLGTRQQFLVGFHHAEVPAVLVEVAYISNPSEEKLLADPSFRQRAAQGMYDGIVEYLVESAGR